MFSCRAAAAKRPFDELLPSAHMWNAQQEVTWVHTLIWVSWVVMCHCQMSSHLSFFEPVCTDGIKTHQVCSIYSGETCKPERLFDPVYTRWCFSVERLPGSHAAWNSLDHQPRTKLKHLITSGTFNSSTKPKICSISLKTHTHTHVLNKSRH